MNSKRYESYENFCSAYKNCIKDMVKYDFTKEKKVDPDQCHLAFEFYYKLLKVQGCKDIQVLLNYLNFNDAKIHEIFDEKVLYINGEKIQKEIKKDIAGIKILKYKNRSGFMFSYKNKKCALEVDTLIGPTFNSNCEGNISVDLMHSVGNFGLIPFGAGRCAGRKGLLDAPYHKVVNRFTQYPSGFESANELGDLMFYNKIDNELKGIYDINRMSTKEEIEAVIRARGEKILMTINESHI